MEDAAATRSDRPAERVADPLADLDEYARKFLPTHLAAAGRSSDLHRLLLLKRGDHSNAWYAVKPDLAGYIADVRLAKKCAAESGDCAVTASVGLVESRVRRTTTVRAPTLAAAVETGTLDAAAALALCESAPDPGQRILGTVALLPHLDHPLRSERLDAVLASMSVRSVKRSGIGLRVGEPELPLTADEHVAVIRTLAALPWLDVAQIERLARAAFDAATKFAVLEAVLIVSRFLDGPSRASLLAGCWQLAGEFGPFRGRCEAQALVAAASGPPDGTQAYALDALGALLDVLSSTDQRVQLNDWNPYERAVPKDWKPPSVLCQLQGFCTPFAVLAPALPPEVLDDAVAELLRRADTVSRLAVVALVPHLVRRDRDDYDESIAAKCGEVGLLATATATATRQAELEPDPADPPSIAGLADAIAGIPQTEYRVLTQIAFAPALAPPHRAEAIAELLRTCEDLDERTSFRREVVERLGPLIAVLPEPWASDLVHRCAEVGELARTESEVNTIITMPGVPVPPDLVRKELARSRAIGPSVALRRRLRRMAPAPKPATLGAKWKADELSVALDVLASSESPAERAEILMFLAPLLDHDARAAARAAADEISPVHLRLFALTRLARDDRDLATVDVARLLQLIPDATGNLDRLDALFDELAGAAARVPNDALRAPFLEVLVASDDDTVAALAPLGRLLDGQFDAMIEQAEDALDGWFGVTAQITPNQSDDPDSGRALVLDPGAGAAALVTGLCALDRWDLAGRCVDALAASGPDSTDALDVVQRQVFARWVSTRCDLPAAEQLIEAIAARTDRTPLWFGILAERLDRAAQRGERAVMRTMLSEIDLPEQDGTDPVMINVEAAAAGVATALHEFEIAAQWLNRITVSDRPYRVVRGRAAARAARGLQDRLDHPDASASPAAELALRRFQRFAQSNRADYELTEAAAALLAARVDAAANCGREIRAEWLEHLNGFADADEPLEVIMHRLAVHAACSAARAAASAGRSVGAGALLASARRRCARHAEDPYALQLLHDAEAALSS